MSNTGCLLPLFCRIDDSVLIRENTDQKKLVSWHILRSDANWNWLSRTWLIRKERVKQIF